jgi:hypothetical protein
LRKQQRKAEVRITVINGVLARQHHKDGSDAGFAPLTVGTYEVVGPVKDGFLEIRKEDGSSLFLPIDKLDTYVERGDVLLS